MSPALRATILMGVLAGLASAVLYVATATGSVVGVLLALLAPLPLFVAGIGWGAVSAAVAALIGCIILTIAAGPLLSLAFFLSTALLPVQLARLVALNRPTDPSEPQGAREWYPAGRLLVWIAGAAAAGCLLAELIAQGVPGGLRGAMGQALDAAVPEGPLRQAVLDTMRLKDWDSLRTQLVTLAPAASLVFWQLSMALNGLLAFILLRPSGRVPRTSLQLAELSLPPFYGLAVAVPLGATLVGGQLGFMAATLAAILVVPYFFLGLTVIHAIPGPAGLRMVLLGLFYFVLVLSGWLALLACLLGFMQQGMGVRERLRARRPS